MSGNALAVIVCKRSEQRRGKEEMRASSGQARVARPRDRLQAVQSPLRTRQTGEGSVPIPYIASISHYSNNNSKRAGNPS